MANVLFSCHWCVFHGLRRDKGVRGRVKWARLGKIGRNDDVMHRGDVYHFNAN
jgi:hypothetical protein